MFSLKKIIFWLSLGFNAIAIVIFATLLSQNGGVDRLLRQISWGDNSTTRAAENDRDRQERYTPRINYYQMRKILFSGLPDGKAEIILLGDSLTDHGEWVELLGNPQAVNRGISGDTTDGILNRIDDIVESKPEKIFLLIGINDILKKQKDSSTIINNYRKILKIFKQQIPKTKICIQSLLPINNVEFNLKIDPKQIVEINQEIKKLAIDFNFHYIDLYQHFADPQGQLQVKYTNDGVHLTPAGYLLWSKQIKAFIN